MPVDRLSTLLHSLTHTQTHTRSHMRISYYAVNYRGCMLVYVILHLHSHTNMHSWTDIIIRQMHKQGLSTRDPVIVAYNIETIIQHGQKEIRGAWSHPSLWVLKHRSNLTNRVTNWHSDRLETKLNTETLKMNRSSKNHLTERKAPCNSVFTVFLSVRS